MDIRVRYKGDYRESFRVNLYLARNSALVSAALGAFLIIESIQGGPDADVVFIPLGVLLIIWLPMLVLRQVYGFRDVLGQEAEVTLTSEGIQTRTQTLTLRVSWDMVERVDELKTHWIFTAKRGIRRIALRKRELTQKQQAELTDFLAARHLDRQVRKGMTPVQEASYALAYGVARSDLKPEVQAEYDRLAAERDPA